MECGAGCFRFVIGGTFAELYGFFTPLSECDV